MYSVDIYRKIRLACQHDGLSQREASRRLGVWLRCRGGHRRSVANQCATDHMIETLIMVAL
jgi:hypothetical protein